MRCLFFLFIFCSLDTIAQSIGTGKDGSPSISGIVNLYAALTKDLHHCDKIVFIDTTSAFAKGDLVLIIQMQGAIIKNSNTSNYGLVMDYNYAGNYEYAFIDSVADSRLFLEKPVLRNFIVSGKTQVIRVPQYVNPVISGTLSCKKWDGETGGVLAVDATGIITMNADINVNGKGFRGGTKMLGHHFFSYSHDYIGESYDPDWFSLKGEGIAFRGLFPFTSGRGAPANAGGGGNIHTAGGGGGSNAGCGGNGGWGYPVDTLGNHYDMQGIGGHPLDYSLIENKIFMGGGGGSGHQHFNNGSDGGNGAGLIIITANELKGNSRMLMANGGNSASSGAYGDGTGGAGAAGTILLAVTTYTDSIFLSSKGGDGGSSILPGFGPGGGGGGGLIWMNTISLPANVIISSIEGGAGGVAGGNYYGADSGCTGTSVFNLVVPFNNYYDGVVADFTAVPDFVSAGDKTISFTNQSTGATFYQWNFGDGSAGSTALNPSYSYYEINNYGVQLIASDSICTDTSYVIITGEFVPDIFTPNGDGVNDYFYFTSFDSVNKAEITIFSRWGKIIFNKKTNGKTDELRWDGSMNGKPLSNGTYFFMIRYTTLMGEVHFRKGYVTMLR